MQQAQAARNASLMLAKLPSERKNQILGKMASAIRSKKNLILQANQKDCERAKQALDAGKMSPALFKRLVLNEDKVEQMAQNLESTAALEDPVGKVQMGTRLDEGLELFRVSCPIGVLLVIFEARPEVVVQITALAIKSGNAVILKGGSEASESNQVLVRILQEVLTETQWAPVESLTLLNTREEVGEWLTQDQYVDLVIPRGSNELVQSIQQKSKIPILAHADGICHIYLDHDADPTKALEVIVDAKTEYPAVCNAMETLLIHEKVADDLVGSILKALQEKQVELRGCPKIQAIAAQDSDIQMVAATEDDWKTEYNDLILSIKQVTSPEEAVGHINQYGSHHTDCIVTEDETTANYFMQQVDAASVFWNASTRFADGFRYGFGAEVGISTSRTHARGPVGLDGLVLYKYKLYGQGQGVARYHKKPFLHETI